MKYALILLFCFLFNSCGDNLIGNDVGSDMKWYIIERNLFTNEAKKCTYDEGGPKAMIELIETVNNPNLLYFFGLPNYPDVVKIKEHKIGNTLVFVSISDEVSNFKFYRGMERCSRFLKDEVAQQKKYKNMLKKYQ